MIAFLEGILEATDQRCIWLNVHGVGYEIFVTKPPSFQPQQSYRFYTYAVYREDSQQLYGFVTREERNFFQLLVEKVNGVGPKLALTLLSFFPMPQLCALLIHSDAAALAKCPGVGKKTAQRLILELKDCLKQAPKTTLSKQPSIYQDAMEALTVLGYSRQQAEALTQIVQEQSPQANTVEAILKQALRPSSLQSSRKR